MCLCIVGSFACLLVVLYIFELGVLLTFILADVVMTVGPVFCAQNRLTELNSNTRIPVNICDDVESKIINTNMSIIRSSGPHRLYVILNLSNESKRDSRKGYLVLRHTVT